MAIIFLKVGGSLITDKSQPYTARIEKIAQLAQQIAASCMKDPSLKLVLGHGSGSFGHESASKYGTRTGVKDASAWRGFAEVWFQASALNRIVVEALHQAGLPVVTFSPVATVTAHDGKVFIWDTYPLRSALANGLLPVIHGDVVFDEIRGGTVLSTEELFFHLAQEIQPARVLLAGMEEGVWSDFPARKNLLKTVTPATFAQQVPGLGEARETDVTGGMRSKVVAMLSLVEKVPGLEVLIFSGEDPANLGRAMAGENPGTRLHR